MKNKYKKSTNIIILSEEDIDACEDRDDLKDVMLHSSLNQFSDSQVANIIVDKDSVVFRKLLVTDSKYTFEVSFNYELSE